MNQSLSNSQRHKASILAGTQNPQHKSKPAKELAFCSAWVTVFRYRQIKMQHSVKGQREGRTYNKGYAKMNANGSRVSTNTVKQYTVPSVFLQ